MAPPATRRSMTPTPTVGHHSRIMFMNFEGIMCSFDLELQLLSPLSPHPNINPVNTGSRTTEQTLFNTSIPSTGEYVPSNNRIRRGVTNAPKSVVESVQITDRLTSPPANKANKLLAWPPLTHPNSIVPACSFTPSCNKLDTRRAKSGIMTKQQRELRASTNTVLEDFIAFCSLEGVMASPMASINIERDLDTTVTDPKVETVWG